MWRSVLSLLEPQTSPLPTHYKPTRRPLQDLEAPPRPQLQDDDDDNDDDDSDYSNFGHIDQQSLKLKTQRSASAGGAQEGSGTFHQLTLAPEQPIDEATSVFVDVDPGAAAQLQQQQQQQHGDISAQTWTHRISGGSGPSESSPTGTPTAGHAVPSASPGPAPGPGLGPSNSPPNILRLSDYASSPPDQVPDATAELRALAVSDQQKLLQGANPGAATAALGMVGPGGGGGGRRQSHHIPPNGVLGGLYGPGLFRHDSYPPPLDPARADVISGRTASARGPPMARFEDLRFVQQIGEGGFGRVYYGYWLSHRVAIKLAHPSTTAGPDLEHLVREFSREVAAMSALPPHKNVLQLLAACMEGPQLALVTDYCATGSLYQLLHGSRPGGGPPPWPQLLAICLGVAQGMSWLHHHSILHRDLKSANILLDNGGNGKIADFGLAKIYNGNRQVLTGGLGTYQWAAPEVLAHQRYSEKADVYSFGIVLWECLTRKLPYEGMTAVQAAVGVVTHGLRPDMPRNTPSEVAELIRACWAAVPEQRPSFAQIEVQLGVMLQHARAEVAVAMEGGVLLSNGTPRQGAVYGGQPLQPPLPPLPQEVGAAAGLLTGLPQPRVKTSAGGAAVPVPQQLPAMRHMAAPVV